MVLPGVSFADANASLDEADFVILGIPFDRTASYRPGSRFAPNAIREASYNFETFLYEHGVDLLEVPVHDMGNMEECGTVDEMVSAAGARLEALVSGGKFPIVLGGEHSVTIPAIQSFKGIGVVCVDAHLDFRDEYLGGKNSHACVNRRIADHVGIDNMVILGVRSMSREEHDGEKPRFIDAFTIRRNGIELAVGEALDVLKGRGIYLTLDIDGIDPSMAPGTGTPEPFGLTDLEVKRCIELLAPHLVGFDLVEVCPPFDSGNTAALAARLVREVIATVWRSGRGRRE